LKFTYLSFVCRFDKPAQDISKKFESSSGESENTIAKKRLIVGLKNKDGIPALDYYLSQLGNSLLPIKSNTLLQVHFSKK
jgi:hypothetical protein